MRNAALTPTPPAALRAEANLPTRLAGEGWRGSAGVRANFTPHPWLWYDSRNTLKLFARLLMPGGAYVI